MGDRYLGIARWRLNAGLCSAIGYYQVTLLLCVTDHIVVGKAALRASEDENERASKVKLLRPVSPMYNALGNDGGATEKLHCGEIKLLRPPTEPIGR